MYSIYIGVIMTKENFKLIAMGLFGIAVALFLYAQSLQPCRHSGLFWCMQKVNNLETYSIVAAVGAFFSFLLSMSKTSK
jgi:hypothetical protein